MASIMTNTSAMTALQTLRSVTSNLETTQDRISTGLKVNNARDNAAYWSIATTMKADIAGFQSVQESLNLGSGTTNTASVAATNIVDNLKTLKQRIITGQTQGLDPKLIQSDVDNLVSLIKGAANDASFNGDNLLAIGYAKDGSSVDKDVKILSSLSRTDTGVEPSYIEFDRQDMQVRSIVGKATIETTTDSEEAVKASIGINLSGTTFIEGQNLGLGELSFTFKTEEITVNGNKYSPTEVKVNVDLSDIVFDDTLANTQQKITDRINVAIAGAAFTALQAKVTVPADWTSLAFAAPVAGDAAAGDPTLVSDAAYVDPTFDAELSQYTTTVAFTGNNLEFTVGDGDTDGTFTSQISQLWVTSQESDAFGGLAELTQIDVVNNAERSLKAIDDMIAVAISKATVVGAVESRVKVQNDFVSKLTDSMNKGVGALVDADMNEESSRLQALQVQQQLAIQALSIANQGPQNILSLFR